MNRQGGNMMAEETEVKRLINVGIIAAFATLAFVGTTIIRIPIPATGGYFNLGDTFVMAAALLYGPLVGALVGLIGPAAADAIGFPQFILATGVIKFFEGGAVGLLANPKNTEAVGKPVLGLFIGIVILVFGYFLFEALIYPIIGKAIPFFRVTDLKAAIAELGPNTLQGVLSAFIAYGIYRVFKRDK